MTTWVADALKNWDSGNDWTATAPEYKPPPALSEQQTQGWFVNSAPMNQPAEDNDWLDDIWGWAKSDMGTSIIGGVAKEVYDSYKAEKMYDRARSLRSSGGGGGGGSPAAALQHQRILTHNRSINQPMDMGMRKLKR